MDNKMNYAIFLSNQMIEEAKFDAYIRESVLISEGKNTIENMTILTESFGDKIKLALAKVVEVFTRICGKFMETVDTLFRSNKGYLEKYKDTILKQKPTDSKWVMYNWPEGMKTLLNTAIPEFNFNAVTGSESKDDFIKKNFSEIITGQKDGTKLQDAAEFRFRGNLSEEQETAESALNITDMYNFCIRYDTMKANLQKDIDNIVKAAKACQDEIAKTAREVESNTSTASTANNNVTPNSAETTVKAADNQTKPQGESVMSYYFGDNRQYKSFVYEGYVQEMKKVEPNSDNKGAANDNTPQATNQSNGNTSETDPNKAMARVDNTKNNGNIDSVKSDIKDSKTAEILINNIKTQYIDSCTAVSAAKMQCLETAYKDYMTIIKNKVRTYVGTSDKDNTQTADAATNQKTADNSKNNQNDQAAKEADTKTTGFLDNLTNGAKNVINKVTGKNNETK